MECAPSGDSVYALSKWWLRGQEQELVDQQPGGVTIFLLHNVPKTIKLD